jgi:uncharacterized membrane protein
MPNIGYYHPIVIHFTIAFLLAGVVLRLLSLTGRVRFASPAAAAMLLLGTLAAVASVRSGTDAHGPAERVPGARDAVVEHEELGERARNVFLFVAVLEIAALALARTKRERIAHFASALVGVVGLYFLFEAAEHGGDLVYSYAGGIGVRTGEEEDVERLLLAGLYHQSQLDRKNGRPDDAAALIEMAARRHPEDIEVQLLAAESLVLDRKAPEQALEALARIEIPRDNTRLRIRRGILEADAHEAAGDGVKARASIEALLTEFPDNARLKRRLEELD